MKVGSKRRGDESTVACLEVIPTRTTPVRSDAGNPAWKKMPPLATADQPVGVSVICADFGTSIVATRPIAGLISWIPLEFATQRLVPSSPTGSPPSTPGKFTLVTTPLVSDTRTKYLP